MPKRWNNTWKIIVSREEVAAFNAQWPGSNLNSDRAYWFDFDVWGLVDTDVPQQDDGEASSAMADDCEGWLRDDISAPWMCDT